jgi:hypothetical protein
MVANDVSAYLSIQVPVQKNECLQAADRDTKLRLDGEGTLEEILVIGPFRRHEGLDITLDKDGDATRRDFVLSFSIKSTRAVVELGKRPEGKYEIDGAYRNLGRVAATRLRKVEQELPQIHGVKRRGDES